MYFPPPRPLNHLHMHSNTINSNKEDLKLIEEMGITPDVTHHARRPTLKSVGLAVIAVNRMRKFSEGWAAHRKVHVQLVQKLESMRRQGRRIQGQERSMR
jgi:hypothetical protein